MRSTRTFITLLLLAPLGVGACAVVIPRELVNADTAYRRASTGNAARLAPAEVHKAGAALDRAARSFFYAPWSQRTRDLGYVAERKAQLAEALATLAASERRKAQAQEDLQGLRPKQAQRIQARGIGMSRPVSDNDTAEGRANNRRVEIIVRPRLRSSR